MTNSKKNAEKPVKIVGVTPEQALFAALNTPMPKKPAARKKPGTKKA